MITNGLLFVVYAWVTGLGELLSGDGDVTANTGLVASVSTASGYMALIYGILPLSTIAILGSLAILLVFEIGLGVYKVVKWGYSKIPGVN